MTDKKRKPSFFRFLLRFLLILLLLALLAAVGLAVWLGVRMKNTDVVLDDIPALLSAQPMEAGERFLCEDGEHLVVALDKSDIWWMLDKRYGMGWQEDVRSAAGAYRVELDGAGLRLEDGAASLDARAHWKSIILTANIPLKITCEDGEIRAVPTGISLGGVPVPEELLRRFLPAEVWEASVSYRPETIFLNRVETAVPAEGKLVLTGSLSPEIFSKLPTYPRYQSLRYHLFMGGYGDALAACDLYLEDPAKTYSAIAPRIGAEPEAFRDFAYRVFALMDAEDYDTLAPVGKNYGFIVRWMPDIGLVRSSHTALEPAYEERSQRLNEFQDMLEDAFCAKKITVQEGQFRYDGEPFSMEGFFGESRSDFEELFGDGEILLCIVALPGYNDPHAPSLSKIADGPESFDTEPDMDRQAPLGVLVMGQDGTPCLLTRTIANTMAGPLGLVESTSYNILPVSAEVYAAARSAEKIPVIRR